MAMGIKIAAPIAVRRHTTVDKEIGNAPEKTDKQK
jgi:hypothetical protein